MIEKFNELLSLAIKSTIIAGKKILKIYNSNNFKIELKNNLSPITIADKESNKIIYDFLRKTDIPILSEEGKDIPYKERKNWDSFWLVDPLDGTKEFINRNGEFTVNIALINNNSPLLGVIYAPVLDLLYYGAPSINSNKIANASKLINDKAKVKNILSFSTKISNESTIKNTIRVIASRSHFSKETENYINTIKHKFEKINYKTIGSSLKFCLIAEGECDIYPRFGPTMEWDTGAGHAIAQYANCIITLTDQKSPMIYNKKNLLNPYFIVISKKIINML
ncbi:MAG: 3'(2'),5'-bisphosphate nucleotidase CysQ [Bacteroidales bacterium]|nr:3'(2'),5'-bisphosphate nucleotidase CysQ [Bacteroidales bacterium]